AAEVLAAAQAQARQALEDTRRAVQGLFPAPLERLSPVEAIAVEVEQFEAQEGVMAQFVPTGEEQPLLPEQRAALLRIAQESLSNIRKHARAQRVRVGLNYGVEEVTLLVEDDGIGFDTTTPATLDSQGGYGLFGMNERARALGGEAQIESTPGWGTRVRVALPYHPASALPARGERLEKALVPTPEPPLASEEILAPIYAEASADAIRVVIADDHAVARQGIRAVLEASGDIRVIGEAADGEEAADQARQLRPDVVLLDLQMPRVGGLEGLRRIHAEQPDLAVVVLTTFQTDAAMVEALGAGARGFLLKDTDPADLIAAVRAASRGEALLSSPVAGRLAVLATGQAGKGAAAGNSLNERELEVLTLLAQGARNKEIAARLFITAKTVEYHLSNIFVKLGVSNRTEAVRAAIERGLVPPLK
ncbi:MAG TPA: response regulator, partial [Chthonomonadaceae bacterium]|nr:response regulator [Chthonomonadaceae bacterium]